MRHVRASVIVIGVGACVVSPAPAQTLSFQAVISLQPGEGEVVSFTPDAATLAVTGGGGTVLLFTLEPDDRATPRGRVVFEDPFTASRLADLTSVALDPIGRGFGAASLVPTESRDVPGQIAFFDYRTGTVLATYDAGFHPDSLRFSDDGRWLLVANEGQFTTGGDTDAPGSLTAIDLAGVEDARGVASLSAGAIRTVDFRDVNLAGIRINDLGTTQSFRHVEPEYAVADGDRAYVTLQENNAFGVFDLAASAWVHVFNLGTIKQVIDASDRDGDNGKSGAAVIDDEVRGLPMPDTLAAFRVAGKTYLATANEGDYRADDGDRKKVKDYKGVSEATLQRLGRLRISSIDSDPNHDGTLERPIMAGTRSFSIWDATTGRLVADSGNLEPFLLERDPSRHNIDPEENDEDDARSTSKGPEPEGLAVLTLADGRVLLAVGMERQGGVVLADVSQPASPRLIGYTNVRDHGLIAPESLAFVPADARPTRQPLLLVGCEGAAGKGNGVAVFTLQLP